MTTNIDYSKVTISKELLEKLESAKIDKPIFTAETDKAILNYYGKVSVVKLSEILGIKKYRIEKRYKELINNQ